MLQVFRRKRSNKFIDFLFFISLLIFTALISEDYALSVVRISNMNDFNFGTWSGTGNLILNDSVCVHDSTGNSNYGITATGSGAANAFTLSTGAFTLPYSVSYQGSVGAMTALTSGVKIRFNAAYRPSSNCAGGTNGTLRITLTQANLLAANSGTYSGILTILVTPN